MTAVATTPVKVSLADGLRGFLNSKGSKGSLMDVIADGVKPERLVRMAVLCAEQNKELYNCDPTSMLAAVTEAARLGLDLGGSSGEAYLVPRKGRVVLNVGYKGLIRLAENSGRVYRERAEIVFENDTFSVSRVGAGDTFEHLPTLGERGSVKGAYAVAYFENGTCQVEWMPVAELDAIAERSSAGSGPWSTDRNEMYKKTVIIRLNKDIPLGRTAVQANQRANEAEGGKALVFDSETGEVLSQ